MDGFFAASIFILFSSRLWWFNLQWPFQKILQCYRFNAKHNHDKIIIIYSTFVNKTYALFCARRAKATHFVCNMFGVWRLIWIVFGKKDTMFSLLRFSRISNGPLSTIVDTIYVHYIIVTKVYRLAIPRRLFKMIKMQHQFSNNMNIALCSAPYRG